MKKIISNMFWVGVLIVMSYVFVIVQLWVLSGEWSVNIFSNRKFGVFLVIMVFAVLATCLPRLEKRKKLRNRKIQREKEARLKKDVNK